MIGITELPVLYHKGHDSKMRSWRIWTENNTIKTESGTVDGQKVYSSKTVYGKNIGHSNETTDIQQAELETQSLWTFKKERKYSLTPEEAQEQLLLSMLAKEYNEKKVVFPSYIQRKVDGNRALAFWENGKIKLLSRGGKEWTVPYHINEQVARILPKDCMFDGELYVHGQSCQTITSWVKKLRPETKLVEYHIYDMPVVYGDDTLSFEDRWYAFKKLIFDYSLKSDMVQLTNIQQVDTHKIFDLSKIKEYEAECIEKGYEGAILRNGDCLYQFGYRSSDLMKIKTFQDSEFKVIDVLDGVGKFEGCAIFRCQNDLNDATFDVTMATSLENKKEQFENKENYIGKMLTVKYFGRTDEGLVRFPVGLKFKAEEDV